MNDFSNHLPGVFITFANLSNRMIKKLEVEIKSTADGSSTIYVPELKEHYHSVNGAVQESMHVFIRAGLHRVESNPVNILEVGFGTGLNAILTLIDTKGFRQVKYHTLELYPLEWEIIEKLQYPKFLGVTDDCALLYKEMHLAPWGIESWINSGFCLHKTNSSLTNSILTDYFNLIYFDAFAPAVQPELWTEEVFRMLFDCMLEGGLLVTYCAKGEVRRCMQRAGFTVERLPGPPGKREILRAKRPEV